MGVLPLHSGPVTVGFAAPLVLLLALLAWIVLALVVAFVFGAMASGRDRLAPTAGSTPPVSNQPDPQRTVIVLPEARIPQEARPVS
ncbi:MAG TPA: hypothetical protein VGB19_01485 [Actinomycetota bacterium]